MDSSRGRRKEIPPNTTFSDNLQASSMEVQCLAAFKYPTSYQAETVLLIRKEWEMNSWSKAWDGVNVAKTSQKETVSKGSREDWKWLVM